MAITKHKSYAAAIASILTTELNSLAHNANTAASEAIDNSSALNLYHDLTLTIATQGSSRSTGSTINVYLIPALDDTNYDAVNETTAEVVAVFSLDASTTARQITRRDIPIPPGKFKYFIRNASGQALAASGNILEYRAHSVETL